MLVEEHEDFGNILLPEVVDITNAPKFKQALNSLYEKGYSTINVDCVNLELIDSSGLGCLVLFQKRLNERDGELMLVNVVNDYIKHFFDIIDLGRMISIEQAISNFTR